MTDPNDKTIAYIESAVQAAMRRMDNEPAPKGAKSLEGLEQRIGGFQLTNDQVIGNRSMRHADYCRRAEAFSDTLQAEGITPIATLPASVWKNACPQLGLFCLAPDKEGNVRVRPERAKMLVENTLLRLLESLGNALAFVAVVCLFAGMILVASSQTAPGGWICLLGICAAILWFCARKLRKRITKRVAQALPWGRAVEAFLVPADTHGGDWRKAILPTPPDDVAQVLSRLNCGHRQIHTAARAEAIRFEPSLFGGIADDVVAAAGQAAGPVRGGVVVYVMSDDRQVVGLVAQFGSLAVQREAVDRTIDAMPVLC